MEVQLSEVRGFGSAGAGELCALPWVVAPQCVGFSLLWAWYNEDRNSLLSSKLLCYFLCNSVCSVGAPRLRQHFQALHCWASRSPTEGDKAGAWCSGKAFEFGSRIQSRFCIAERAKMVFTFLKGYKQIKTQRRICDTDHA